MNKETLFLEKYNHIGPYYTNYPTGKQWYSVEEDVYFKGLRDSIIELKEKKEHFGLYVHIPFCVRRCRFCFCSTSVTRNRDKIENYLNYLKKEVELFSQFLNKNSLTLDFKEFHFGGGSPSYLSKDEFIKLVEILQPIVNFKSLHECTIEIDAINIDEDMLELYANNGVNRISFGIQDFDPDVQKAINRVQSIDLIRSLMQTKASSHFKSINFDLMYGLPCQTPDSFRETMKKVIQLRPNRISLYNYYHNPGLYNHQGAMDKYPFPSEKDKVTIFMEAQNSLLENGYEQIGIDHFSLLNEDLSVSKRNGQLTRSFMGYTAGVSPHIIGLGSSSLSGFNNYYFQNLSIDEGYYEKLDKGILPLKKGYCLSKQDFQRRKIINKLMTYFEVDLSKEMENDGESFNREIDELKSFIDEGWIELLENKMIKIKELQPLIARHIAGVFDQYRIMNKLDYIPQTQRSE